MNAKGELLWVEIAQQPDRIRLECLSAYLNEIGLQNKLVFISSAGPDLATHLKRAMGEYHQIRLGGELCRSVIEHFENVPLGPRQIGAADSLIKMQGRWWPRNFTAEGIHRALVFDIKKIDLTGSAFVLGSDGVARAAIYTLAKLGFQRFSLSDQNQERGESFVESLKKTYFGIQFQFIPRHMITQLPSVHTVAVNTLVRGKDDNALEELYYFNFLSPGGIWLDLVVHPVNTALKLEATAVGAAIESGIQVATFIDSLWAQQIIEAENQKDDQQKDQVAAAGSRLTFDRLRYAELLLERLV